MTNALQVQQEHHLSNIQDVAKFAIFNQEKLKSIKAEISVIERLGLAQEVWEQKKREAQEVAELATDAFIKVGEFSTTVSKASGGDRRSKRFKSTSGDTFENGKVVVLSELGFSKKQVSQAQKMARHPDIVEQAKAAARANDDIVNRSLVLEMIKDKERLEKRQEIKTAPPKPVNGKYDVLLADPPWEYDFTESESRAIANHYPTMALDDIKALDIIS